MKLYILEGVHASGKSTFLRSLPKGIPIIEEEFCEKNRFPVDSMLHQIDWLLNWEYRVLELANKGVKIAVSDRGPNTSVILHGTIYHEIAKNIFRTMADNNIVVQEILMVGPYDINEHYCRILQRKGPLMATELKTLREVRDKYFEFYKNHMWIKPKSFL